MKKIITLITIGLLLLNTNVSVGANPDLSQAKRLCSNATEAQKQAAKAAGYDVDSLCSSLKQQTETDRTLINVQTPAILPRETAQPEDVGLDKNSHQITTEKMAQVSQPLKKFGYDLFAGEPTTYTPVGNIPVPANYIVGPGDIINVQLYGKENNSYQLQVGRDGAIQFPELGPIYVSGLNYEELKESLNQQIKEQILGVQANISMGELRSIQIFVLGEAYKPGAYTISSLSTMLNALYVSGGVKEIGSLRNIQLKRNGQIVSTLDLYDLLLEGDTRKDQRLQAGDVIYIPSVKTTASVSGEVVRPAIYELKNEKSISELISLAGGFLPNAYPKASKVQRVTNSGNMTVIDVDLSSKSGSLTRLKNGDLVQVFPALEQQKNIITLAGHVYRPGVHSWRAGMKVSDIISNVELLKPNANLDFVLLVRETQPLKSIKPLKINLREILNNPLSESNISLESRDKIIVLNNAIDETVAKGKTKTQVRNELISQVIIQLKAQANLDEPTKIISIKGAVKFPGDYPLIEGMSVVDLIHAAGGLIESAFALNAEVSRYDLTDPLEAKVAHLKVDLQQEFLGNVSFKLNPHDQLNIKVLPEYRDFAQVIVRGEVSFPGEYRIQRGETLSDLIKRVGGLNQYAHVEAAVFSRKELREHEQKEIRKLQDRLQQDIAVAELEDKNIGKSTDIDSAKSLLDILATTEATGRLVINLQDIIEGKFEDVVLKDGDSLYIPAYRQEITVVGEVQVPTSHLYDPQLDYDDYILRSGGEKDTANDDAIYIVKANGSVVQPNRNSWLNNNDYIVEPGDTIVVPFDTQRVDQLELWSKVSSIVYQLALGAAAVKSF